MRKDSERAKRIMDILRGAYLRREDMERSIDPFWQHRVMAHIHEAGGLASTGIVTLMGQFSWRLIPATASLAAVLAVLVVKTHLAISYNPLQLLMSRAEDLMLTRLLGV